MGKTLIVAIITFLIDQISKWYVVFYLDLINVRSMEVFPPLLNFHMGWNYGVNFGLFANSADMMRWVLIGFALLVSIGVLIYARKLQGWFAALLMGCIIGGAIANAFDRVIHGAVADFLNMSCCGINNPYAFNIADVFIFIGAIGLALFSEKLQKRA